MSPDFLNALVTLQINKGLVLTGAESGQQIRFFGGETKHEAPAHLELWTCPRTSALSLGHPHTAEAAPCTGQPWDHSPAAALEVSEEGAEGYREAGLSPEVAA